MKNNCSRPDSVFLVFIMLCQSIGVSLKVLLFKAELEEGRTSTITGSDDTKLHLRDGTDLLGAFIIFDNYLAILLFSGADSLLGTFVGTVAFSES